MASRRSARRPVGAGIFASVLLVPLLVVPSLLMPSLVMTGCKRKSATTSPDSLEAGMRAYLAKRGAICLGKTEWPIDVPVSKVSSKDRDARQMPVFERLGLVRGTDTTVDTKSGDDLKTTDVRRYELTEAGAQYYVDHEVGRTASGEPLQQKDFCVVKLSLDKIVHADIKDADAGQRMAVVEYTYAVDAPAWTRDPEIERVLPFVAKLVKGAGSASMTQGFTWTHEGWVANELLTTAQATK